MFKPRNDKFKLSTLWWTAFSYLWAELALDRESIASQCINIHRNPRIPKWISIKAWIIEYWYPWKHGYPLKHGYDNLWYPVNKRPWYPVDILDIRLLDSVKTWLFLAIFQVFYSLAIVLWFWLIFTFIQQIFFNILLKSIRYLIQISSISLDICLLGLWYPANIIDILISCVQFSSKVSPLVGRSLKENWRSSRMLLILCLHQIYKQNEHYWA